MLTQLWNLTNRPLTLRVLDIPVGVFSPSVRDADVGVDLFDASVKVDASGGVLHLVTSVI